MPTPTTTYDDTELNLEILGEEAGEVIEVLAKIIRIKSKIARFGLTDYHPKNKLRNDHALEEEIGHFLAMVGILTDTGVLSAEIIEEHIDEKLATLGNYYYPMRQSNIVTLVCGLCGNETKGRQWGNSTEGCGVCSKCYAWVKASCNDKHLLRKSYGDEGYHFNIKEKEV